MKWAVVMFDREQSVQQTRRHARECGRDGEKGVGGSWHGVVGIFSLCNGVEWGTHGRRELWKGKQGITEPASLDRWRYMFDSQAWLEKSSNGSVREA